MNKMEQIVAEAADTLLRGVVAAVLSTEVGALMHRSPADGKAPDWVSGDGAIVYWAKGPSCSVAYMPDGFVRKYTRATDLKYKLKRRRYSPVELRLGVKYDGAPARALEVLAPYLGWSAP